MFNDHLNIQLSQFQGKYIKLSQSNVTIRRISIRISTVTFGHFSPTSIKFMLFKLPHSATSQQK